MSVCIAVLNASPATRWPAARAARTVSAVAARVADATASGSCSANPGRGLASS